MELEESLNKLKHEFNQVCEKHVFAYHEGYHKYKDNPDAWGDEDRSYPEFSELRKVINKDVNNLKGYSYTTSLGDVIFMKGSFITINGI